MANRLGISKANNIGTKLKKIINNRTENRQKKVKINKVQKEG